MSGTAEHLPVSIPPSRATLLHRKLREVPHKPGVYVIRDRFAKIIYVGKARDLRRRLSNYFTPSSRNRVDLKTRALIDSANDYEWHLVKSDAEAVLFEGKLIKEWRPKYNISFRDDKRFIMVRIQMADAIPRFELVRFRKEDGARYFGPFANAGALRTSLQAIKKQFGLRSCRPLEPSERDFKHCLDHVIKNCSAPCVAKISREEYKSRVDQACEVLEGKSREMTASLEEEMEKAAEKLDFEKAASLRNLLKDLRETSKPMRRFTRKSLPNSINPREDVTELSDALGLARPPRTMECFDISNISDNHIVASMVRFRDGVPDRESYRRYRITSTKGQNDFASMAEVIRRRYKRLLNDAVEASPELADSQEIPAEALDRVAHASNGGSPLPDLIIVDGGKGQLGMACRELQSLGLHSQPIIGLAKEFEEIYRPGESAPLRLDKDSGALKLLQRIRDEAHRVANGYNELLLRRRISESALDDVPGVSEAKKKVLLTRFGSISRIKKTSPETLAEVQGISKELAERILAALNQKAAKRV
ncbi:MAG: excinuclease ABC subunit UvrC [Verrucomicrobiota bacterium]